MPQNLMARFAPRLQEGSIYYIRSFEVLAARARYRPVDHPYRGRFTTHTNITPVKDEPAGFPRYAYRLSTYDKLGAKSGHNTILSGSSMQKTFIDVST